MDILYNRIIKPKNNEVKISMKNETYLKEKARALPLKPGVYIMKNASDEIIYIGKAKNLKNRVSSYFLSNVNHNDKVKKMVENIDSFDYIITDSEFEALVLECSLIKKHMPKHNILLKDDKGYSFIKITNENWPRVLHAKQKFDDGAIYIGPYTNSMSIKKVIEETVKIFKIPTCNRNLNKISKRPCLNYYIGRCSAPCIGLITHKKYLSVIDEAIKFIKNGSTETLKHLVKKMNEASQNLDFEQAAEIRDKIKAIENIKNRQKVVSYKIKEQDVIAAAYDKSSVSFEVFRFSGGDLFETQNFIVEPESDDIITTRTEFLEQYYTLKDSVPKNVVLDGEIENSELIKKFLSQKRGKTVNISIPKKGEQLKLVEMCKNNAYEAMIRSKEYKNRYEDILEDLKNILSLKNIPKYIEAYDISNLQGSDNVGGMVVLKNGRPLKAAYKRFKINTVLGQNDYSSMREIIKRRINNYLGNEEKGKEGFGNLPDLILIDGGVAHTRAARDVLNSFKIDIPVFGMVKDGRHRTRAITTNGSEIEIKNNSRVFSFITSVQNEVHRYTISYHKKLRNKKVNSSELTKIDGIGKTRAKALLKAFGSVEKISKASVNELTLISGITESAAKSIYNYFHKV